ncbi:MAG: acetyl-CoA carboxylase biotin carboxylase subunit [Planctomycetota bacterium]
MFRKILVANRGEIAVRILRTLKEMGILSTALFSDADRNALHTKLADEAIGIGGNTPKESYLQIEKIIHVAKQCQAQAIHPGYGFLAENAVFAERCQEENIVFIGPSPYAIRLMGSKIASRTKMMECQVPVVPGYHDTLQDITVLQKKAQEIGFPIIIKASAGGGGKGMRICARPEELFWHLEACKREAKNAFGEDTLFLEHYIEKPRHIEFQIIGDHYGKVLHLFERECSIQRRHQKIIEEAPSIALNAELRATMGKIAVTAAQAVQYNSVGTIEFLLDPQENFYFLEMNTRIQVEHPVTEAITGLDLIREQICIAQGEPLSPSLESIKINGNALECRLYAEDPQQNFLPTTGTLTDWYFPPLPQVRIDTGISAGEEVSIYYDPLLAKIITHGPDRLEAIRKMEVALKKFSLFGCTTNLPFLLKILQSPAFIHGKLHTHFIEENEAILFKTELPETLLKSALLAGMFYRFRQRFQENASANPPLLSALPPGFRNNRTRPTEESFQAQGHSWSVFYVAKNATELEAQLSEDPYHLRLVEETFPHMRLEINGRQQNFRVLSTPEELFIHTLEGSLTLKILSRFPETKHLLANEFDTAPMPGKVTKIFVSVGDQVTPGTLLLILEAMKMEHTVVATQNGKIREIYYQIGDLVQRGSKLFDLEP